MKKLQTFFNLSITEKEIFFKAFFLSAYVRFVTLSLPMHWWYKTFMGEQSEAVDLNVSFSNEERKKIYKTWQMVKLACRYAPWEAKCLVESILLKKLCSIKAMPIFLGINKIDEKYLAHAWIGIEKTTYNKYKVVSVHI